MRIGRRKIQHKRWLYDLITGKDKRPTDRRQRQGMLVCIRDESRRRFGEERNTNSYGDKLRILISVILLAKI